MSDGTCVSCNQHKYIEHVTVRTYRKREEMEYRYRLCLDCLRVLQCLLESNAEGVQRGIFNHATGTVTRTKR